MDELLEFFKALSDGNRLKLVGLLSQEDFTVEQLAAMLELRPSTVSHHLSRLARAGLVSARADGYYSVYHLETQMLEDMAHRLLSREQVSRAAADLDLDAYDRKVLADFSTPDRKLKTIPAQRKKREVILRHLAADFHPGEVYSEDQINRILQKHHEDSATLRRELVAAGLMRREHGQYSLKENPSET